MRTAQTDPRIQTELLTDSDRQLAAGILEARERVARRYTRLCGIVLAVAAAAFCLLYPDAMRTAGLFDAGRALLTLVLLVVLFGLLGLLVYWRGWLPIRQLRADLEEGRKRRLRGEVEQLGRVRNVYGETVTHAVVQGVRLRSREPWMLPVTHGQALEAEILPRSGIVLSARPPEQPPAQQAGEPAR